MKEKKGLFARLAYFWKETIRMGLEESIGFWMGAEKERHRESSGEGFAAWERKTLWQKGAAEVFGTKKQETGLLAQERMIFAAAEQEQGKGARSSAEKAEGDAQGEAKKSVGFFAEGKAKDRPDGRTKEGDRPLWGMERFPKETAAEDGNVFLWRQPEAEEERHRIVPTAAKRTAEPIAQRKTEEVQEIFAEQTAKQEKKQAEPSFDIDGLMRQITKRLWEERESCGRRLRG